MALQSDRANGGSGLNDDIGEAKRLEAQFFKWGRLVARGTMVSSPEFPPQRRFPTDHTIPDTWIDFGPQED